jgi:hypothetical protein
MALGVQLYHQREAPVAEGLVWFTASALKSSGCASAEVIDPD